MEMKNILSNMDLADLAQRYNETFIDYAGVPLYIKNLSKANNKLHASCINYSAPLPDQTTKIVILEPALVNLKRPPVQWYLKKYSNKLYPFYLHYTFRRQWKRGVCEGNTSIYFVDDKPFGLSALWPEVVLKRFTKSLPFATRETIRSAFNGTPQIVQDKWLFTSREVFFGAVPIAKVVEYNIDKRWLRYSFNNTKLVKDLFRDDFMEVIYPNERNSIQFEDNYAHVAI